MGHRLHLERRLPGQGTGFANSEIPRVPISKGEDFGFSMPDQVFRF